MKSVVRWILKAYVGQLKRRGIPESIGVATTITVAAWSAIGLVAVTDVSLVLVPAWWRALLGLIAVPAWIATAFFLGALMASARADVALREKSESVPIDPFIWTIDAALLTQTLALFGAVAVSSADALPYAALIGGCWALTLWHLMSERR